MRGQRPKSRGITYAAMHNMKAGLAGVGSNRATGVGAYAIVDEAGNHMINEGHLHGCINEPIADIADYDYSLLLSEETRAAYNAWRNR